MSDRFLNIGNIHLKDVGKPGFLFGVQGPFRDRPGNNPALIFVFFSEGVKKKSETARSFNLMKPVFLRNRGNGEVLPARSVAGLGEKKRLKFVLRMGFHHSILAGVEKER